MLHPSGTCSESVNLGVFLGTPQHSSDCGGIHLNNPDSLKHDYSAVWGKECTRSGG